MMVASMESGPICLTSISPARLCVASAKKGKRSENAKARMLSGRNRFCDFKTLGLYQRARAVGIFLLSKLIRLDIYFGCQIKSKAKNYPIEIWWSFFLKKLSDRGRQLTENQNNLFCSFGKIATGLYARASSSVIIA